jgi:PleD family two-component response regulator
MDVPVCWVSLIDACRQWMKSCVGRDIDESLRGISFCDVVAVTAASLVVEDARHQSLSDRLLGIWNRGGRASIVDQQVESFRKDRFPFSLLMVDIDNFKQVNDSHGHLTGDAALKSVTRALQVSLRPNESVAALKVQTARGVIGCALSIGVAEWRMQRAEASHALIDRADAALLLAKQGGRSYVLVSHPAT